MKWRNIDVGNAAYFITGTITEWLPLLSIGAYRQHVCDDVEFYASALRSAPALTIRRKDRMLLGLVSPPGSILPGRN